MNQEAINSEIDRHLSDIVALSKAIEQKAAVIERLRQQKGKIKTGVGQEAIARRLMWEQKKQVS